MWGSHPGPCAGASPALATSLHSRRTQTSELGYSVHSEQTLPISRLEFQEPPLPSPLRSLFTKSRQVSLLFLGLSLSESACTAPAHTAPSPVVQAASRHFPGGSSMENVHGRCLEPGGATLPCLNLGRVLHSLASGSLPRLALCLLPPPLHCPGPLLPRPAPHGLPPREVRIPCQRRHHVACRDRTSPVLG